MELINGVRFYSSERVSDSFLRINSCGYTSADNVDVRIERKNGRRDYQLLYVSSGRVRVCDEGRDITLGPGNVLVYRPGDPQIYTHMSGCGTLVYWVHFTGAAAGEILSDAGFGGKYAFAGPADGVAEHIAHMLDELHSGIRGADMSCAAHFLSLLTALSRACGETRAPASGLRSRFRPVITRLNLHCEDEHPVDELAEMCALSKYHFIRLFRQATGLSPHAYLVNVRMEKAGYLLKSTGLGIAEIAGIVGYSNPLYFSRLFTRRMGMPPTEFRDME